MENFAQGPLATTIPGGADWGCELLFPKTRNPFVQSGALSTDWVEITHASPFPTPFDQAGAIDGGMDQLKESWTFIPLCRILKATNDFDDALVIGDGGFGKVYKAIIDDGATTTVVAITRLSAKSNQYSREFWTDVEWLSKFRHANLASLIGYCHENQEKILVYEYMAQGTLANHLYKTSTREESGGSRSHLTWEQRLNICLHAARGLDYLRKGTLPLIRANLLHNAISRGIIHRDVKSTNILLDKNLVAKIFDLELSKSTTHTATHGSTNVIERLTTKSEVYAFGVVLLEVLCGQPPIDTSLDEEQISLVNWALKNIKKGKLDGIIDSSLNGDTTPDSLKYFAKLASKCLHNQPKKRPAMVEVVKSLEIALLSHEPKRRSQRTFGKAWTLGTLHRNPLQPVTLKRLWGSLIRRKKKDMGEGLNGECLTKTAVSLDDSTTQNSVYTQRGRGCLHSMELKQPATFRELGVDPDNNKGIISDLLRFLRDKEEFYKKVGKDWNRGYLLYDSPCPDRLSLIAAMANRLEFDIYDLDLTGLSSISELRNMLVSIRNRSLIAIKDGFVFHL